MGTNLKRYEKSKGSDLKLRRDHGDNLRKTISTEKGNSDVTDRGDDKLPKTVKERFMKIKPKDLKKDGIDEIREIKQFKEKYVNKSALSNISFNKTKDAKDNRKDNQIGRQVKKISNESDHKSKPEENSLSIKIDTDTNSKENTGQRRPSIKTVIASNDGTKVYKAVTFTDQKRKSLTPLQIKIPSHIAKKETKIPKLMNATQKSKSPSGSSVKEKPITNRKHNSTRRTIRNNRDSSNSEKDSSCPATEVAKWVPNSIDKHTKHYYEAWVDTTLAAISKSSKYDKLYFEKQKFIQNFQRALERAESPDLVHENFTDERYMGKIKVNHK